MSVGINVRSELDKTVEVNIWKGLSFVCTSIGLLHLVVAVGSLARAAARIPESKCSMRCVVNDNQIGAKLQEIINGPARGNRRVRSDGG